MENGMPNDNLLRLASLYIINDYWCTIGRWKSPGIVAFKKFAAIDLWISSGKFLAKGGRWNESPNA